MWPVSQCVPRFIDPLSGNDSREGAAVDCKTGIEFLRLAHSPVLFTCALHLWGGASCASLSVWPDKLWHQLFIHVSHCDAVLLSLDRSECTFCCRFYKGVRKNHLFVCLILLILMQTAGMLGLISTFSITTWPLYCPNFSSSLFLLGYSWPTML